MKRACLVTLVALTAIAAVAQPVSARPKGRIFTWPEAVKVAKEYNKLIFCIYTPGITQLYGPGKSSDNTAAKGTEWPIVSVIVQPPVRKLEKKYYIIAHLRTGDKTSNWETFAPHAGACLFATHQGEFLEAVTVDVTVTQFIEAVERAVAKAKELRAADPPTPDELLKEAEDAIEILDYVKATAKIDEALKSVQKGSILSKRTERLRKTIIGRATGGIARSDGWLKQGKPIQAFRELDEVAHLFTMLPQAAEAEKKLEALLTDPKWAEAATEYRPQRKAYDLLDEGMSFEAGERWKEAAAKYQEIIDGYKQSPVVRRAAGRLSGCQEAMKKKADT